MSFHEEKPYQERGIPQPTDIESELTITVSQPGLRVQSALNRCT